VEGSRSALAKLKLEKKKPFVRGRTIKKLGGWQEKPIEGRESKAETSVKSTTETMQRRGEEIRKGRSRKNLIFGKRGKKRKENQHPQQDKARLPPTNANSNDVRGKI